MYEFTHLIAEAKSRYSANLKPYVSTHDILDTIEAFHQISFNYLSVPPVSIKTKPVLFILRRRENYMDFLQNITAAAAYFKESEETEEEPDTSETTAPQIEHLEAVQVEVIREKPDTAEKKIMSREVLMRSPEIVEETTTVRLERRIKINDLQSEKARSREVAKSKEKIITETNVQEDTKEQKKSIKKSIKKLISKYRRMKTDKTEGDSPPSDSDTSISKISVKQLIQQEKANVEKEELRKIQQQVISLIESNPNIINKDIIKQKIETTVMEELTSAVEPDNQPKPIKPRKEFRKKTQSESISSPPESKKVPREKDKTLDVPNFLKGKKAKAPLLPTKMDAKSDASKIKVPSGEEHSAKEMPLVEELEESVVQENVQLQEDLLDSRVQAVEENAVDIYESPDVNEEETSEEFERGFEEAETDIFTDADIEAKLHLASEQIENLMTIISEIVDTMEVTEEEEEEEKES